MRVLEICQKQTTDRLYRFTAGRPQRTPICNPWAPMASVFPQAGNRTQMRREINLHGRKISTRYRGGSHVKETYNVLGRRSLVVKVKAGRIICNEKEKPVRPERHRLVIAPPASPKKSKMHLG